MFAGLVQFLGSQQHLVTHGVAAQVVWVGSIALLGAALSLDVAWYMYFVYVPLIYVVGSIPLTPGGVGLIEGLYVRFLVTPTIGASEVVALALLARLIPILWSLPGAVVVVRGARLTDTRTMKAELGLDTPEKDQAR